MHNGPPRPPAAPAHTPSTTLRLLRMEKGQKEVVRTLSESYRGCFVHHVRNRSEYCQGEGNCQHHKLETVWKGYCSAEQWIQAGGFWVPVVLEITESLDQDFWGRFRRGQVWQLNYLTKKDKLGKVKPWKIVGELWEERDPFTFPEPYSMQPVLDTLYHFLGVKLDKDNPLPRRLIVPLSQGNAPNDPRKAKEEAQEAPGPLAGRLLEEHNRRASMHKNGHK